MSFLKRYPNDINAYKLKNKTITIIVVSLYIISCLIIIYNLEALDIDLKVLIRAINTNTLLPAKSIMNVYVISVIISISFIILLYIQKLCIREIEKLVYCYMFNPSFCCRMYIETYSTTLYDRIWVFTGITDFFNGMGLDKFVDYLCEYLFGEDFDYKKQSATYILSLKEKKHFKKVLKDFAGYKTMVNIMIQLNNLCEGLFILSPMFIACYDSIYNNLVLIHVYPYLLIYIPIITIGYIEHYMGRLSEATVQGFSYIMDPFWNMYYRDTDDGIYTIKQQGLAGFCETYKFDESIYNINYRYSDIIDDVSSGGLYIITGDENHVVENDNFYSFGVSAGSDDSYLDFMPEYKATENIKDNTYFRYNDSFTGEYVVKVILDTRAFYARRDKTGKIVLDEEVVLLANKRRTKHPEYSAARRNKLKNTADNRRLARKCYRIDKRQRKSFKK